MKAKSADYIKLQNIYKTKARQDVAEVFVRVQELDKQLGRPVVTPQKEVEAFCKSAGYVKLVRGRKPHLAKNPLSWHDRANFAANELTNPESLLLLYIAFLAYDEYVTARKLSDTPAAASEKDTTGDSYDTKCEKITALSYPMLTATLKEANESIDEPEYTEVKAMLEKHIRELMRADGGELHNIASATGGMVAQEVIKVITKQYVPVDNTCLFDGIRSKTSVLRL
jgi:amyloid beta precursor protein binding protein 1